MLKRKTSNSTQTQDITKARILYYDFFAGLFLYDLLINRADLLLKQIEILKTEPIIEGDENYFNVLENEIKTNGVKNLLFEYTRFFMLPFDAGIKETHIGKNKRKKERKNPQIILYLSYYLDETIAGSGLIKAKEKVRKSKVRLNEKEFKENEEHFGFLFVFTKYLLQNGETALQNEVFKDCIKPMKDKIIKDIGDKHSDSLYFQISRLLNSFLDFENAFLNSTSN
ncbi:hypothetical protein CCY99_08700 [Helicobacter sp. 16-1353]|uniref:molecular chaperone TorD family protein n=1 Tax=Helicobacter sp. 16-1353 TaxID=2004996 RepID=UPI000DCF0816|nr:molecular chaperone TorD family protein [Helicobacter sp. 16-1353]RAX51632.1 hypothetical protein CCY99_08700 [Helicobacter sp. 16-1353]